MDLVAGLVLFMERAIDYFAAALPLTAGSLADPELLRRLQVLDHHTKWIGTLPARRPIDLMVVPILLISCATAIALPHDPPRPKPRIRS